MKLQESKHKPVFRGLKNVVSLSVCPHCKAGADGNIVSLFWEDREQSWHCIICGYRGYDGSTQPLDKKFAQH